MARDAHHLNHSHLGGIHMPDRTRNDGGFVTSEPSDDGVDTVIVTSEGAHVHHCPGGITEDDLVD
jgi:hypothetical protein